MPVEKTAGTPQENTVENSLENAAETLETRRKRLLHRARYRGFREADILVGGFAEEALPEMSAEELAAFEILLACNDHDLYAWITGGAPAPGDVDEAIIARMRAFDAAAKIRAG
ncbi:MAG: succinate dehydrogenase assembly factor 2 [Parvularculaceae bacterium]|nr:succinate dehydrogenase assembly factor 2 [Parvularculaceae bacterium]